jgi:opacity protein-like surface antigen
MKRLALFLTLTVVPSAFAQLAEFSVHGGQSRLRNRGIGSISGAGSGDELQLKDGFRIGFRLTLNNWRFLGHEFGYAYNRTALFVPAQQGQPSEEAGTSIHQGFYNFLVYATPEGTVVRPFAAGGVHFNNYVWPGYSVTSGGGSTKFGVNYGGGVKVRVHPMFLIRFDVRDYRNPKPFDFPARSGWLGQTEFSAGFALAL